MQARILQHKKTVAFNPIQTELLWTLWTRALQRTATCNCKTADAMVTKLKHDDTSLNSNK